MINLPIPTMENNAASIIAATALGAIAHIAAPVLVYAVTECALNTLCLKLFSTIRIKNTSLEGTFFVPIVFTAKAIGVFGASLLITKIMWVAIPTLHLYFIIIYGQLGISFTGLLFQLMNIKLYSYEKISKSVS